MSRSAGFQNVYISNIALDEIMDNAEPKLTILLRCLAEIEYTYISVNDDVKAYSEKIIEDGILTVAHYEDCLHIACAVVNDCNIILSWNFNHIVKAKTVNGIRSINAALGYHGIDIYSPNMIIN